MKNGLNRAQLKNIALIIHDAGQRLAALFYELQQRGSPSDEVSSSTVCVAHGGRFLSYQIKRSLLQAPVDCCDPHAERNH